LLSSRELSSISEIKAGPQDIDFSGLKSNLKMRAFSGVVLVTYHRHLRAL
jgi:hypothetical protein